MGEIPAITPSQAGTSQAPQAHKDAPTRVYGTRKEPPPNAGLPSGSTIEPSYLMFDAGFPRPHFVLSQVSDPPVDRPVAQNALVDQILLRLEKKRVGDDIVASNSSAPFQVRNGPENRPVAQKPY